MRKAVQHFIDGQWVDSDGGAAYDVINPATAQPCATGVMGTRADVDRAVAAARRAFDGFSRTSVDERLALLDAIIAGYKARMPEIAQVISEEMGAPIGFATMAQAPAGLGHFIAARKALAGFEFESDAGGARVVHEGIGVVGMITPWNWPVNQIAAKVGPALAAGNTIVLKPSEECPGNAIILAEIIAEAGVPAGVFNLVQGDGPTVGAAMAEHPGIDMISITGSTRAGIAVAQAAAATVKRVHQELGGKAPNLVLPGTDLAAMLPATVQGVIANSGQSCIAPTRILVSAEQRAEAETVIRDIVAATPVSDPSEMGGHIGPLVNAHQFARVQDLIQSAIDEGATLLTGGVGRPEGHEAGYFVKPTVLSGVTPAMRIWREETFGPVATITEYDGIEEGVRLANDTPYGLSATVTGDPEAAKAVVPRLRAGLVTVNSWAPNGIVPFGGYGQSGNGREGGKWGLADFMEVKTIIGA